MSRWSAGVLLVAAGCIAPSVLPSEERSVAVASAELAWGPATVADVPGTYVSTEIEGELATVLRKVVYLFQADGAYTGAALVDDLPPRFEVISGTWSLEAGTLRLDGGPPAAAEVAEDGTLRLIGDEGLVVLRREVER